MSPDDFTDRSEKSKNKQADAWERWGWLWTVLFYGALVFSSAMSLSDDELASDQRAIVLALVFSLAVWHAALIRLGQERIWSSSRLGIPLIVLGVAA